ncbi:MAG TPA: histidine kinase [Burkholderiales bacterium]|nr:histidine kinase [Burkholderiales bacterium]
MTTLASPVDAPEIDMIKPSAQRDLLIVVLVTFAAYAISSMLELSERLIAITRPFEAYQLDELPVTLAVMILALAWFSWRRSRQALEQLDLRLAAQRELAEALRENRMLSQRYLQAQEEERRQIARELHDELGQSLNAIKVDAVAIRDNSRDLPEIHRSAQAIVEVSSQVYEVVRSLMRQLRPVALDELGLSSAVQYCVDQWQRRHPDVRCSFSARGDLEGMREDVNITVYRMVQECLTNVAKHSSAARVGIEVSRQAAPAGDVVAVRFEDDGQGFEIGSPRHGLGLIGLRERVEALGGHFEIETGQGIGVRVRAEIPCGGAA